MTGGRPCTCTERSWLFERTGRGATLDDAYADLDRRWWLPRADLMGAVVGIAAFAAWWSR